MAVGIGAGGIIGIAFEATAGTYEAPDKYVPIASESLKRSQETHKRRVIRGVADPVGSVLGNATIEGEISMEVLDDCLPWFLYASRAGVAKSGAGPYTYTVTGNHSAVPTSARTLSITVVRNGICFAYVGCAVGASEYSIDDGVLMVKHTIVGTGEAVQSVPTPTWPTSVPYGMGMYAVLYDAGAVTDVDSLTLSINDNGTAEHRLEGTNDPSFVRFGERQTTLSLGRDFESRTDYDAFKALTAQAFQFTATNGAASVTFDLPVVIKGSYELGLSAQGDLVRATIDYEGDYDATTTAAYEITIVTATENIT